jgi:hypothetical protein
MSTRSSMAPVTRTLRVTTGRLPVPPIEDPDEGVGGPALATEAGFLSPADPGEIVLIRPEAFVQLAGPSIDALLLTLGRIFLHLVHAKYPGRVSQPADWIRRALPAREAARSDDLDGAELPDFARVQPCSRGSTVS